ncbi:putative ribonuclease H-like domain-containing protein [Tanacetum coccineum]
MKRAPLLLLALTEQDRVVPGAKIPYWEISVGIDCNSLNTGTEIEESQEPIQTTLSFNILQQDVSTINRRDLIKHLSDDEELILEDAHNTGPTTAPRTKTNRVLHQYLHAEIQAVKKMEGPEYLLMPSPRTYEKLRSNLFPFAKQTEDLDLLHEDLEQIDDGCTEKGHVDRKEKERFIYQHQEAEQRRNRWVLPDNGYGNVNWENHTEVEEINHALIWLSAQAVKKQSDEVLSYEEEMNFSVFKCSKEDSIGKPLYSRFTKTNDFKGVPHPLSGDYTPKPQEEIDDSLYVYGKKGPQKPEISVSDDNSSEHSTCQSNDSEGSCGNTSEHSFETESESISVPNEMSTSRLVITNEKVVSELQEVEPSCAKHVKTPRQPLKDKETHKVNRKNWNDMMERELGEGYSFTKKKCFVCGSLSHLIKDCDYYEKKMAREAEVKRVVNTGNRMEKPVWTKANRVNHSNKFVLRSVQLNAGRPKFNSVRPNINTGRTNINSGRPKVNTVSPKVNTVRSRQPVPHKTSNSEGWGSAVRTSASYNWGSLDPNFHYNRGPTFNRTLNAKRSKDHPLKNMVDRGIFDSGCSGHMTGNKGQLENFEEFNVGSVTFGELGHFNLFSISQICDKQHKVLFTETECLVVSSDFKMPDENQILLKVPRHHNMYSFDMKTPTPAKGFACLIAKATSDESKLWHRRLGHINFKNLNKLVKGNLVRGLPSKVFKNDHTCVACHKGKQHRASCKAKLERLITEPLHTLHMDLFGPTSVKSINHASYCLVITDDCTRFSWVFFLASKDETSGILQTFIRQIENQLSHRVKIIRSDNGTEFKNRDMLEFSFGNQANPMQGASEVTINNAGTSQTPSFNASEEKDEDVELIVVPSTVRNTQGKAESRKSSTNSKKEEILTELQQEKKAFSTDTSEDNPKIQAFRRELEEIALKHLGKVSENTTTSTTSVNTGSEPVNTGSFDDDDSPMPELEIFHKSETGIFDEASYDEEGVITDFNSLPTEIEVSPTPTLRIHSIHPKSQILGDPKSAVQTRSKVQNKSGAHALLSHIQKQQRNNHKDQQHCLFACFLSQEEPKKIAEALQDDSWVQAMQEELL